jgi:acyl carrier protein
MSPSVYSRLKRIIVDQLGVDDEEVALDAAFVDDLNASRDELLDLVMSLEEEFGIEIPPAEAARYFTREEATVGGAADYLEERLE